MYMYFALCIGYLCMYVCIGMYMYFALCIGNILFRFSHLCSYEYWTYNFPLSLLIDFRI